MKARIQQERVLLFGFLPEEEETLRLFFENRRVSVRTAPPAKAGEAVGALLGLPGFPETGAAVEKSTQPLIVFSGFSGSGLQAAVRALSRPDLLKASATPYNLSWTAAALIEELLKEREALKR